jgi:hypothetical protein
MKTVEYYLTIHALGTEMHFGPRDSGPLLKRGYGQTDDDYDDIAYGTYQGNGFGLGFGRTAGHGDSGWDALSMGNGSGWGYGGFSDGDGDGGDSGFGSGYGDEHLR